MTLRKYGQFALFIVLTILLVCGPIFAQAEEENYIDYGATHAFQKEVDWLADNVAKETKSEFDFRTKGFVAYADSKPLEVGDVESFNTYDLQRNASVKIKATLKKIGKHCLIYLENGRKVSAANITKIAKEFDAKIYPKCRKTFGSEWSPGIDGNKRITLLLLDIQDGYNPQAGRRGFTAGYFYAGDEYNRSENPKSNEREMLYLDTFPGKPGSQKFMSVIAHEFQHMIHWNKDPKEFTWVNESLSQLSSFLCGYGHPPQVHKFIENPDNNLCGWKDKTMIANYGQVYLWAYYISKHISSSADRQATFIKRMIEQKSQGLSGLNAAIKKQGIKTKASELFKSFCVANFLNDTSINKGLYGYDKNLSRLFLAPAISANKAPLKGVGTVECWSAKAVSINTKYLKSGKIQVSFAGQEFTAGKYKNKFAVAAVLYDSARKLKPIVEWLNVRSFKASQTLKSSLGQRNKMMLVVVNMGPVVMKVEQAFAKGAPPAKFSFAVSTTTTSRVYATKPKKKSTKKKKTTGRSTRARNILEEMANESDVSESDNASLGYSEDGADLEQDAVAVTFDFKWRKKQSQEDKLVNSVKVGIFKSDYNTAKEFFDFYKNQDSKTKSKFDSLKQRIKSLLKFEALQGDSSAKELLEKSEL